MRRVSLAYVVYFTAIGAAFPYLPVYYRSLGLSLAIVGAIAASQAATQLVTAPIWGALADRFPRRRATLPLAALVAAGGAAILAVANDVELAVGGSIVLFAGLSGIGPILDARTLEALGTDRNRYGQIRAWGSLAFVVAAAAVGLLLDRAGERSLFLVYLPALLATALLTATMGRSGTTRSVSILRGSRAFLASPGMGVFLVGAFLVWTSLIAANAFYSIQIVALGGSQLLVGLAWAIGALIEVPIMWSFPRLARRFGTERLLILGAASFAVRAAIAAFAKDPVALVAVAPIEGVAFACTYVGAVTYLAGRAPAGLAGTAQGLFSAVSGSASIAGAGLGGLLAGWLAIPGLFGVSAAASAVAAVVVAFAVLRPAAGPDSVPLAAPRAELSPD